MLRTYCRLAAVCRLVKGHTAIGSTHLPFPAVLRRYATSPGVGLRRYATSPGVGGHRWVFRPPLPPTCLPSVHFLPHMNWAGVNSALELDFLTNSNSIIEIELALPSGIWIAIIWIGIRVRISLYGIGFGIALHRIEIWYKVPDLSTLGLQLWYYNMYKIIWCDLHNYLCNIGQCRI